MDLENVPDIRISKEKEIDIQRQLTENYKESNRLYAEWEVRMRKSGYSEEQIDNMFCY